MGAKMLVKLKDGGIQDIRTDEHYEPGCPTCDYGSKYINEFEITLTKHIIKAHVSQMYEYRFSVGSMMRILLPNLDMIKEMTELEFITWFKLVLSEQDTYSHGYNFDFVVEDVVT